MPPEPRLEALELYVGAEADANALEHLLALSLLLRLQRWQAWRRSPPADALAQAGPLRRVVRREILPRLALARTLGGVV